MNWYAAEKGKGNGVGAANILELVKEEFYVVGPSERMETKMLKGTHQ